MIRPSAKAAAGEIFRAALQAADPEQAVRRHLRVARGNLVLGSARFPLKTFHRIYVVGAGKASARMAQAIESLVGASRISAGRIVVPDGLAPRLQGSVLQPAGHPVPDLRGVAGARKIADLASQCCQNDLLISLISGGASALMPLPGPGITLARKKQITKLLLARGATIHQINCVRKHISAIKGGWLAKLACPATVLSLILSDVIGDDLDVIGSGPTVPDSSTCEDARAVLRKYRIPAPELTETPKPGDPAFARVHNVIVGSNRQSMDAAVRKALELGYKPIVLSTTIDGETRDVARMHAAIAREMIWSGGRRVCFLSGGETTVTLKGNGLGGRNQEFVLAALHALESWPAEEARRITLFSAGTDGIDGPTDAAGACADLTHLERARKMSLDPSDYLARNDSYHFFERTEALLRPGPTGTNVMDVRMILID